MDEKGLCPRCHKPAITLHYAEGDFACRHCLASPGSSEFVFIERGVENPMDPHGTTAHVKDIKDRRWHPTEKRMFYYSKEKPKSYFFQK